MLRDSFFQLLRHYKAGNELTERLWDQVERKYNSTRRYYHNLDHLAFLFSQLQAVRHLLSDWHVLLFALYYHDIVYKVLRSDNEERSAALCRKDLTAIGFEPARIERCSGHILATKTHNLSDDKDTNYFTDADTAILGQDPATYRLYCTQVRREYGIFPFVIYKSGRIKVLQYFLAKECIFKTPEFFNRYETTARANLQWEMAELQKSDR